MRKILLLMFTVWLSALSAGAYDLVKDGVYFNIMSDLMKTAEVTYMGSIYSDPVTYIDDVTIPETVNGYRVVSIGLNAFRGSYSNHVTMPSSIETIKDYAFYESFLRDVTIPGSVATIGDWAFTNCTALREIILPDALTGIGQYAFMNSGLNSVTIPDSVHHINQWAFGVCSNLESVTLGCGVLEIRDYAFRQCNALTSVTCLGTTPPTIRSSTFDSLHYNNATLMVPATSVDTYKAANYWKNFLSISAIGQMAGDVNGDGNVNISDVSGLIDLLLGGGDAIAGADVNGDGCVSISDVSVLIDMLLGSN